MTPPLIQPGTQINPKIPSELGIALPIVSSRHNMAPNMAQSCPKAVLIKQNQGTKGSLRTKRKGPRRTRLPPL